MRINAFSLKLITDFKFFSFLNMELSSIIAQHYFNLLKPFMYILVLEYSSRVFSWYWKFIWFDDEVFLTYLINELFRLFKKCIFLKYRSWGLANQIPTTVSSFQNSDLNLRERNFQKYFELLLCLHSKCYVQKWDSRKMQGYYCKKGLL